MSQRTRSEGRVSAAMALYLGELYRLGGERQSVSPSALAAALEVSLPAVARMAARMAALGLVERERYRGLRLTARGCEVALREIRAHRLAEAFLVRVLGYGWHEAHDLAEALAEIADPLFVERMEEKAGFPRRCPHGEPIPDRQGVMPVLDDVPLADLAVGDSGTISRVRTRDAEKLQYLQARGLLPGRPFQIAARAPFEGPIRLRLDGGECVLGRELADHLRVERRAA